MFRLFRNEKGFTMIEMMVVLIIIAVLIGGGMGFYNGYIGKSKKTKAKAEISVMQAALDAYYAENDGYPGVDELDKAGIDENMIGGSGANKKYTYTPSDQVGSESRYRKYEIITTSIQGDKKVKGTGEYGKSSAPSETD